MKQILSYSMVAVLSGCGCSVVDPGNRGIKVTMGAVDTLLQGEGIVWHAPLFTSVEQLSVRQQTASGEASCFSSDLQAVGIKTTILFSIPEASVIRIFREYAGNPMDSLIRPRVFEALKEVTALYTAEGIAKNRETIKIKALESSRSKIGDIVAINDLVLENISLSPELAAAIEQKMVQEQEAAKAKFTKQKAEIEAQTTVLKARAEAESITVTGRAIRENPGVIQLELAKRWNGVSPLVTGSNSGVLLPLNNLHDGK
jgi:prohibitin 2